MNGLPAIVLNNCFTELTQYQHVSAKFPTRVIFSQITEKSHNANDKKKVHNLCPFHVQYLNGKGQHLLQFQELRHVTLDISKTFEKVCLPNLFNKLPRIPSKFCSRIKRCLSNRRISSTFFLHPLFSNFSH